MVPVVGSNICIELKIVCIWKNYNLRVGVGYIMGDMTSVTSVAHYLRYGVY